MGYTYKLPKNHTPREIKIDIPVSTECVTEIEINSGRKSEVSECFSEEDFNASEDEEDDLIDCDEEEIEKEDKDEIIEVVVDEEELEIRKHMELDTIQLMKWFPELFGNDQIQEKLGGLPTLDHSIYSATRLFKIPNPNHIRYIPLTPEPCYNPIDVERFLELF
jgi:hypothetical protein